jgi:hypothetical protein
MQVRSQAPRVLLNRAGLRHDHQGFLCFVCWRERGVRDGFCSTVDLAGHVWSMGSKHLWQLDMEILEITDHYAVSRRLQRQPRCGSLSVSSRSKARVDSTWRRLEGRHRHETSNGSWQSHSNNNYMVLKTPHTDGCEVRDFRLDRARFPSENLPFNPIEALAPNTSPKARRDATSGK